MRTQTQKTRNSAKADPVRSSRYSAPQFSYPLLQLHQQLGNQAVQRLLQSGHIQAELTIGQPDDKYEQEADRVADQVMRMPDPTATELSHDNLMTQVPDIQRLCPQCEEELQRQPTEEIEEEEEELLQAKEMPGQSPVMSNELESTINSLRGGGQALPSSDRSFFEPRFTQDFSQVRIHTDTKAASAAKAVNARAFTLGRDIVFGSGQYSPGTESGQHLLAHELTHVMQQGEGKSIQRKPASMIIQRDDETDEAIMIAEYHADYHRLVSNWYTRYLTNLETNARNARAANQRFIEFEEGGISQLRTAGSVGSGIAYLFGTPGAVVALCIIVLTEVAAQNLSSRSAKIAAAAANLDNRLARARAEVTRRREILDDRISMTETIDWSAWMRIARAINRSGVPRVSAENIIYRDLLLAFARGGGYSISGSQWNVDNLAIFGDAPWYHTNDWGSPGWTNGQDIAAELNALAEGDPSTRTTVSINR